MPNSEVRYCTTEDGVRIAYCVEGEGPPLVQLTEPQASHLQLERMLPGLSRLYSLLAATFTVVRFDSRGVGVSDRNVQDLSLHARLLDLEAVASALGLQSFSLFASGLSGPVAMAFAGRSPERISHLVLVDCIPRTADLFGTAQVQAVAGLLVQDWEMFTENVGSVVLGWANDEARQLGAFLRSAATQDQVRRYIETLARDDATAAVERLRMPALVLHHSALTYIGIDRMRDLVASMSDARLVLMEGRFTDDVEGLAAAIAEFCLPAEPTHHTGLNASRHLRTVPAPAVQPQSFASGRYLVRRLLGEGGQKTVFLARDTQLDRDVAVALLKAEGLDKAGLARLRREAKAMARLEAEPHIVAIYDIGEHEGRPFTVCEYLAGGTLEQKLARTDGPLPYERAVAIARDVCRALVVAHSGGIIHRDIKPSNIWLTGVGSAKLGDFGLATALDRSRVTQAGTVMGTAAYMAPEQALGGEIDQRSDLYSLGCVLYEMLTGRPPFVAGTAVAVVSQHINASPIALSKLQAGLPRAIERLATQMLAKAPEDRPQTAAEVLAALEAIA